jgi:hypothetical protein
MADDTVMAQLATRLDVALHRKLKVHCAQADTTVMAFVDAALRAHLANGGGGSTGVKKDRRKGKTRPAKARPAKAAPEE